MAMTKSTPRRPGKPGQNRDSRDGVFGHLESQVGPLPRVGLYARVSTPHQHMIGMQRRRSCESSWNAVAGRRSSLSKRSSPDPGGARRGRSLSDLMLTLRELQELDVAFVSLTEAFDLTTSTGRAMAAMVAVFAEFEREIRSERVRAEIEQARHEGRQHGRPRSASLRQGRRRFARVIDTDERIWKVPESVLKHSGGARRAMVITRHDKARADYRMGDEVTFTSPDGLRCGEIVKLNPKTAKVRYEETSWNVPYGLLRRSGGENVRNGAERAERRCRNGSAANGRAWSHGLDPRVCRGQGASWRLPFPKLRDPD